MAEIKLNERQEKFCKLYASDDEFFASGIKTYVEVYKPDKTQKNRYNNACSAASQILSNTKICDRINELLEDKGLNDSFVDKQLLHLINQHAEKGVKLGAIKEYNTLKSRIAKGLTQALANDEVSKDAIPAINININGSNKGNIIE